MRIPMKRGAPFLWLSLFLLGLGCYSEDLTEKKTLFDDDHHQPAHWPIDLGDAAAKMRECLTTESFSQDHTVQQELSDLVSWTAEVAADTDLTEKEWLPIYNASEALLANLRASKNRWNDANRGQAERLSQLLEDAHATLQASGRSRNHQYAMESEQ